MTIKIKLRVSLIFIIYFISVNKENIIEINWQVNYYFFSSKENL